MRKRKGLALIKLLVAVAVILFLTAIFLPMAGISHPKMSVINSGPLDIRLVGVRPDGGRDIYDPNGKRLDKSLISYTTYAQSWKPESQYREFIFEVPKVEDQLLFTVFQKLKVSDSNRGLGGSFRNMFDQTKDPSTLVYSITFNREYQRRFFFLTLKEPIRYVDFTLRYFYGPRAQAICTFTGPFALDKTYKAEPNLPYEVTFQEAYNIIGTGIEMRFVTTQPFDSETPVIMYDSQGMRYFLHSGSGRSGSGGANRTYREIPLSLDEIAAVTFGEQPYEITFKNVKVEYPGLPVRTHPEYLDLMAERLNLTGMNSKQLSQYDFKNPQEAIEVIDIVQGQHISKVIEAFRRSRRQFKISELDQPTQDKIRKIANEWASDNFLESAGILIGLQGKWPEFFDLAIERLGKNPPQNQIYPYDERSWRQSNRHIAKTMANFKPDELTPDLVKKIKKLIIEMQDGPVSTYLFYCLDWTKSQETTDALWELAQNEKPWIWWPAVKAWYRHVANNNRVYDNVPEKIKLRLLLILNNLSDENLDAKANELLKEIFAPEFVKMDSENCNTARKRIAENLDKKEATEIYINYLRRMQSGVTSHQWINNESSTYMAYYIIRTLNVWYGINIGNLGTDETQKTIGIMYDTNLPGYKKLLAQAIQWYQNNNDTEPLKPVFAGKVADTAGNPVAGARLSLTGLEYYQNDHGGRSQRKVELAKRLSEDDGSFSFDEVTNEEHYLLEVTADGFLAKERLHIQRLDDGRYRYQGYNEPVNYFIMQRPGKISGTVIGADGQPLANTKLELFANNNYSDAPRDRNITTDSQGKFVKDDMAAEPAILSYTRYRRVEQERRSRREYDGLCGFLILEIKEGQELSGIVLDLSKSVCSLELQVTDAASEPVNEISINFSIEMPKGCGYPYGDVFHTQEVSSEGLYRFDGLPPGKWHLFISNRQYSHNEIDIELSPEQTAQYKVQFDASSRMN